MDPRFECPFCGKERCYLTAPEAVTVKGRFYFKSTAQVITLNSTFCNPECFFGYIKHCYAWEQVEADGYAD